MQPLQILAFDLALPAATALAILSFAWRRRELAPESPGDARAPHAARRGEPARCAGAWAFGLALLAAFFAIFGEFALPLEGRVLAAKDWLPFCVVGALLLSTLALIERVRRALPRGGAGLVVAVLVLLSLRVRLSEAGGTFEILAVFAAAMLTWSALELSSERLRGPLPCLVLALACAASGATIFVAGSGVFGRLCGSLGVVLCAAALVAWRRRVFTLSGGPATIVTLVLVSAWINAWAFGALPLKSALALCAAVVVPCYAGIGPLATWKPLPREIARTALVALFGGAAFWIAHASAPAPYGS